MLDRHHPRVTHLASGLAWVLVPFLTAADPVVSVSVPSLSVAADANEVLSVPLTVTNTGAGTLRFRLRDSGSGLGGASVPPQVVARYPTLNWTGQVNGVDFDGLGLWRTVSNVAPVRFAWSDLETSSDVRLITPTGLTWKPGLRCAWDGGGLWCGSDFNNFVSGGPAIRRLARYAPTGTVLTEILLGGEAVGAPTPSNPAWDGQRVWFTDTPAFQLDTANGNARTTTSALTNRFFNRGKSAYAGYLWGFIVSGSGLTTQPATTITRIDPANGATTNYAILPSTLVTGLAGNGDGVSGQAVDGWGRFLVVTIDSSGRSVTHVDTGLRGWMTCADATPARIDLGPGESRTFIIRMDGAVSGIGTATSAVWVDSNDPAQRRVVVPVTFSVSNQVGAAPTAAADTAATDRDITLTVPAPGVMNNDRGVGPLTAQLVTSPAHGTLSLSADGGYTYVPTARFIGVDTWTYRVTDGLGRNSSPATVTITVRDIPHITLSDTVLSASVTANQSVQVPLQITNSGGGTLQVNVVDDGSGGTPGVVTAISRLATKTELYASSSLLCCDGQGYWTYQIGRVDLLRIDATTGTELDRLPHGLQDNGLLPEFTYGVGIAWTGTQVAIVDTGVFGPNPSGGTGQVLVTRPRIRLYDPVARTQTATYDVPVPLLGTATVSTGLAVDPAGFLWCAAGADGTYRLALATGVVTRFPALASTNLGQVDWYDGSLWAKDRGTIKRFNPVTGAQLGSWSWPTSGDTIPTVNNAFRGIANLGSGRFAIAAGTQAAPQILTLDLGMVGWLSVAPTSLSIPAGTTQTVQFTCNGARAALGANTTRICLLSNDLDARQIIVPITCTVTANAQQAPVISVPADATPALLVLP